MDFERERDVPEEDEDEEGGGARLGVTKLAVSFEHSRVTIRRRGVSLFRLPTYRKDGFFFQFRHNKKESI